MKKIYIVDTGVTNIASVLVALKRLAVEGMVTRSVSDLSSASWVMLPGVGSFAAGMESLRRYQLDVALSQRIAQQRPTFAICLGMQLLGMRSEESPGIEGLGLIESSATKFSPPFRVPHFGWNQVRSDDPFFGDGYAYFANSYRFIDTAQGWSAAWTEHGQRFVSAIRQGPVVATQFHPELSGGYGQRLLQQWIGESAC